MESKNENTALTLLKQGEVSLREARKTVNLILKEMSAGSMIDSQMHTGDGETLFVFMANGICATFHRQAFNPQLIQEGGNR